MSPQVPVEGWYREHVGFVCNSLQRLGVADSEIEDLAHDVFVVAHQRGAAFDDRLPARPWLFGIAAKVASGRRNRAWRSREVATDTLPDRADEERPSADVAIDEQRRRERLHRAVDTLDDDRRAIFVLHDIEGTPVPQAAKALDVPLNTAYSRLRSARMHVIAVFQQDSKRGGEA